MYRYLHRISLEDLIEELEAVFADVVIERVRVVANVTDVCERGVIARASERRHSAQPAHDDHVTSSNMNAIVT